MPSNTNTLGRDISLVLNTRAGELYVPPEAITGWRVSRRANADSRKGMAGPGRHRHIFDGYEGSFSIDRFDDRIERHFAEQDAAYFRGENTFGGTIQETVANPDGSISQWRYTGVSFNLTDLGERTPDDAIVLTVEFLAAERVAVV